MIKGKIMRSLLDLKDENLIYNFLENCSRTVEDDDIDADYVFGIEYVVDLYENMRKDLRDVIDPSLKPLPSFNELLKILEEKMKLLEK